MGEAVQVLWLSDINGANAPYYQIVQNTSTEFRTGAVGNGLLNVARSLIRGDWSIYYKLSGPGTLNFDFFLSWDGENAIAPSSSAEIIAGVTTGVEQATGFSPVLSPWLGVRATEQDVGAVNVEKLILTFH